MCLGFVYIKKKSLHMKMYESKEFCVSTLVLFLLYTAYPVIFTCLDCLEFVIWGLFTQSRIHELSISI